MADMLSDIDRRAIVNKFNCVCKGKAYIYVNDKHLGTGGEFNINDKYFINLIVFPYPREIFIELIEKYQSNLMLGKTIKKDKLENFEEVNKKVLDWVEETTNKMIEKQKEQEEKNIIYAITYEDSANGSISSGISYAFDTIEKAKDMLEKIKEDEKADHDWGNIEDIKDGFVVDYGGGLSWDYCKYMIVEMEVK